MGLTDPVAAHTIRVANKALDLIEAVDRFNAHGRYQVRLRIGVDAARVMSRRAAALLPPIIP